MRNQLAWAVAATGLVAITTAGTFLPAYAEETKAAAPAAEPSDTKAAIPAAPAVQASDKSIYDKIWGFTKLYNNPDNPWIEELNIVGREQVDYYHFQDGGVDADNFADRRTRLGFKAKVFKTVTVHSEVDLNLEGDGEVYNKLTDAYVKWSPAKYFNFTVGKQSAKFTLDGSISSTQLVTIDRSNVANNFWFPEEYIPGVSVNGDVGNWSYNVGYFSAGDSNSEFGDFSGGSFLLMSGGYNFASLLGVDKAVARVDYVWQDTNSKNDFTRPEGNVGSLNFQLEKGRWGLGTDVDVSDGSGGQSDLVGGQIMPSVRFCDTWQGVLRYTGISSDDPNGIRFARYENKVVSGKGDEYNEIYLGVNKYFYDHKLKWQTGIQYAKMDDSAHDGGSYDGWGITTGLRVSW